MVEGVGKLGRNRTQRENEGETGIVDILYPGARLILVNGEFRGDYIYEREESLRWRKPRPMLVGSCISSILVATLRILFSPPFPRDV